MGCPTCAVNLHAVGQPRFTRDIDVAIVTVDGAGWSEADEVASLIQARGRVMKESSLAFAPALQHLAHPPNDR
jgi:hypothetical protein